MHFEHDRSHKANLKQYNVNIFGDGSARNLTTGRNIDKEVIDGFLQSRLAGSKKSFFEPICKARLKTGTEKKKKILKSLSVLKEDCQAFGLLGNKAQKLAEAFKYPMYL